MRHRVFAAINFDEAVKRRIEELVLECRREFPPELLRDIRFVEPRNWHVTLSFLGYQDETGITNIVRAMEEAAKNFASQDLVMEKLVYGPEDGRPRMIWFLGDKSASERLGSIKKIFEDSLEAEGVVFRRETRPFTAHITLARFAGGMRRDILPKIERSAKIRSIAASLDLMESTLKRNGAEYDVLQRFNFRGD